MLSARCASSTRSAGFATSAGPGPRLACPHGRRPALLAALGLLLFVLAPRPASARSTREYSYPMDQTWPAALRFLRIDEGCKILEKDAEAGYVVFELTNEGRTYRGSLELVRTQDDRGRAATRFVINVVDRPVYSEDAMLDRLGRKLHDELGEPPAPAPPPAEDKPKPKEQ